MVCTLAGIAQPCPTLKRINKAKRSRLTAHCNLPHREAFQRVIQRYALADQRLHTYATERLIRDVKAMQEPTKSSGTQPPRPRSPAPMNTGSAASRVSSAGPATVAKPCGLLLFLHIEKTGGSTIVRMLEEYEKRGLLLFYGQRCGFHQFSSQVMEQLRQEAGLAHGVPKPRRLDRFMRQDAVMVGHRVELVAEPKLFG